MVYISYVRMCNIFKRPTTYFLSTQLGESLLMVNLKLRYSENATKFEKKNLPKKLNLGTSKKLGDFDYLPLEELFSEVLKS